MLHRASARGLNHPVSGGIAMMTYHGSTRIQERGLTVTTDIINAAVKRQQGFDYALVWNANTSLPTVAVVRRGYDRYGLCCPKVVSAFQRERARISVEKLRVSKIIYVS